MCMAENSAGKRLDISSLVVIDDTTPTGKLDWASSQLKPNLKGPT